MNPAAKESNEILEPTVAGRLLSEYGKRIYFPKGIVSQSAEAGKLAKRYNATIGMAYEKGQPMILPAVAALTPGLTPAESVSYAPVGGVEELRLLWKRELTRKNPGLKEGGFSLPIVVPGLTPGVTIAAQLFVNPGDTVIIPDLFWDNYGLIFSDFKEARLAGFDFFDAEGHLNCAGLKQAITRNASAGKIILVLNFPNNPAGYSPSKSEVFQLGQAVKECAEAGTDILAIFDDAYYGLFYEADTETQSVFTTFASLHERVLAVKVDGATKEDFVWGFRVAFLTYGSKGLAAEHYAALLNKTTGALRVSVSNSSRLAQSILIRVMKNPEYLAEKAAKLDILKKRYRKVREILAKRTSGRALRELPFNSGYFMSFRCEGISAEKLRQKLLENGIGTISLQDRLLRIAYTSIEEPELETMYAEIFAAADELARV
jgi:aspartate/methionine/tyrosine aminotransferase